MDIANILIGLFMVSGVGIGLLYSGERRKRRKAEARAESMETIASAAKESEGRTKAALEERDREVAEIEAAHRVIADEVREVAREIDSSTAEPVKIAGLWNKLMGRKSKVGEGE